MTATFGNQKVGMVRLGALAVMGVSAVASSGWAGELQARALKVLDASCGHCHRAGQETHGNIENILDVAYLERAELIDIQAPHRSRLLVRMKDAANPMPPVDAPRDQVTTPSGADVRLVEDWLSQYAAEAKTRQPSVDSVTKSPADTLSSATGTPELSDASVQRMVRSFLAQQPTASRSQFRFLSFANLALLKTGSSSFANQLRNTTPHLFRAAAAKAINSLHWSTEIVELTDLEQRGVVLAIPLQRLRDRQDKVWSEAQWEQIIRSYPYGLKSTAIEDHQAIVRMTGTKIPIVRGDWFLANALRPPLYHQLLQLPDTLDSLEQFLGVDVEKNLLSARALRIGFINSGVSKNANRLVERHESRFGYYWKSYDFLPGAKRGNIIQLPTGPDFESNPFGFTAFQHDGGEVIFSLPNGLQGYYLATAVGARLDFGPPDLVSDDTRVSGSPLIVNGLSCIACHSRGVYPLPADEVLRQTPVQGDIRHFVASLHRSSDAHKAEQDDRQKFNNAWQKSIVSYLSPSEREAFDIDAFPEPVKVLVSHHVNANMELEDVAAELGMRPSDLKTKVENDPEFAKLGLRPLVENKAIKRDDWERMTEGSSKFQLVARQLGLGTPLLIVE